MKDYDWHYNRVVDIEICMQLVATFIGVSLLRIRP